MGGSSKSSSSSSQSTNQYDNRIAAQDNAIVVREVGGNSTVQYTDFGAIEGAQMIADKSLDTNAEVVQSALDGNLSVVQEASTVANSALDSNLILSETAINEVSKIAFEVVNDAAAISSSSLDAIALNADKAFEFVDKQRQDTEARALSEIIPWLVGGASVIAISLAYGRS